MKKIAIISLFVLFLGIIAYDQRLPQSALQFIREKGFGEQLLNSVSNSEFLPGPLRGSFLEERNSILTENGVVLATNAQRELHGQLPLHSNEKLNRAAEAKLQDMFAQQYFEHNSPQGVTPADVVKKASYEYIVVGENLALGNFKNDEVLVQAWMDSPGHRANILNNKFQEIGVAVGKGMFEGKQVWLAVQEFGTPLSSCPGPDPSIKRQIDSNRQQIDVWQAELAEKKDRMERTRYESKEAYDAAADEYNELARRTNALIDATRAVVETYNAAVNTFNQCLENNA